MAVGIWWLTESGIAGRWRCGSTGGAFHVEAILYQRDAETSSRAVFGGVGGVQEIGEEESDKLKRHADHAVPDEGEEGAHRQAFIVDLIGGHTGSKDGGFPIGRSSVCGGLFVTLLMKSV